jgi:hypothetical protein
MMRQSALQFLRTAPRGVALGCFVVLSTASFAAPSNLGWTNFANDLGTSVQYPSDVFPVTQGSGRERLFTTADGRAQLRIYALRNERGESPARYLNRVFVKDRDRLTYDRVTSNFFAISAPDKGRVLYRRCNFSNGGIIHCIDLRYPAREKRAWDSVVTRISLSLRPRG